MNYSFFHLRLLSRRLLILLVFYTLCRLIFFGYNYASFSTSSLEEILIAFLHGLRFDLTAIIYINLLYIIMFIPAMFTAMPRGYYKAYQYVYYVSNFFGFLFNLIDMEYFRYQKKRTTFELFSGENDIVKMLPSYFKDYWWIFILAITLTYLLHLTYKQSMKMRTKENKRYMAMKAISLVIFFGVLVVGARGGLQTKPIQMIFASYYGNAQNAPVVLNTPFTIFQSLGKKTIEKKNYLSELEMNYLFNTERDYTSSTLFNPKNVVVIILESFSNEYIGQLSKKTSYAPFLDSLISEAFLYEYAYANGKKSNEAMPSIIASIPSLLDEAYSGSIYQDNNINTLPSLLKKKGYHSSFFHGGFNGSMNFDAFAKKAGYDKYYGMNEYGNMSDFDGNWGIYDEPFMKFFAQTLGASPKPFISTFFSLSSHPPFAIPAEYKSKFKNAPNEKLRSFLYTDYSLRKFFEYAKTKKWFYNTVFVILPDHTPDADDPYFDTRVSYYRIPIIFYDPTSTWKGRSTEIADQLDVMPTVLDYLHYDEPFYAFGQSLLRPKTFKASINYRDGIYQYIDSTHVLQYADDKILAVYDHQNDWFLKENKKGAELGKEDIMKRNLEAFIQKFNVTLIENNYSK